MLDKVLSVRLEHYMSIFWPAESDDTAEAGNKTATSSCNITSSKFEPTVGFLTESLEVQYFATAQLSETRLPGDLILFSLFEQHNQCLQVPAIQEMPEMGLGQIRRRFTARAPVCRVICP